MKLRLVCEGFGIDEIVEIEKYIAGDILFKRKVPRRFEFMSGWDKDDFKIKWKRIYNGYLKSGKSYHEAYLKWEDE